MENHVESGTALESSKGVNHYLKVLNTAGKTLGLTMTTDWLNMRITFKDATGVIQYEIINNDIGLNTSLASLKSRDKCLCHEILASKGIPSVLHFVAKSGTVSVMSEEQLLSFYGDTLETYGYPFVVKPNMDCDGEEVFFVSNQHVMAYVMSKLAAEGKDIALSPFEVYDTEYTCTVLNNEVVFLYGKSKSTNRQNNLSRGAKVVPVPTYLDHKLNMLAVSATKALGLSFANVDIISTDEGLKVLEVNDRVVLKQVLNQAPELSALAVTVYIKAFKAIARN